MKLLFWVILPAIFESPPARGRGLKLAMQQAHHLDLRRPPRGGVD